MPATVYLTKSRYQCLRRQWLDVHQSVDWIAPEPGSAEEIGIEIGRMARLLFPDGVLVEEPIALKASGSTMIATAIPRRRPRDARQAAAE